SVVRASPGAATTARAGTATVPSAAPSAVTLTGVLVRRRDHGTRLATATSHSRIHGNPKARPSVPAGISVTTNATISATSRTTKKLNTTRAHAPTDIGDQYLKIGPSPPGVVFTSMCQKRRGLPRSRVSRTGHTSSVGNAT